MGVNLKSSGWRRRGSATGSVTRPCRPRNGRGPGAYRVWRERRTNGPTGRGTSRGSGGSWRCVPCRGPNPCPNVLGLEWSLCAVFDGPQVVHRGGSLEAVLVLTVAAGTGGCRGPRRAGEGAFRSGVRGSNSCPWGLQGEGGHGTTEIGVSWGGGVSRPPHAWRRVVQRKASRETCSLPRDSAGRQDVREVQASEVCLREPAYRVRQELAPSGDA